MQIPLIIVDDDEVDRLVVMMRLDRSDRGGMFNLVFEANTGAEFLDGFVANSEAQEVKGQRPLVLMDVNLPGKDGFETIEEMERQLRSDQDDEGAVVMMFTSSQSEENIEKARALGRVKGYIVKPFDDHDIERIVDYYEEQNSDLVVVDLRDQDED